MRSTALGIPKIGPGTVAPEGFGAGILTIAFGTTVFMWAVGYVGRLPLVVLPSPLLLSLLMATLFAGGLVLGRHTSLGCAPRSA